MPTGLFAAEHYREVRKPVLQASTLPPHCYTDDDFFQLETERVFRQHWQFAGREEQLDGAGSFFCYDGPGIAAIVTRDANGEIRAFANSCRHRGARLLNGSGHCKRIVCPYHSWSYRTDGQLVGAPGMEAAQAFELEDYPLVALSVASWAGFLFIHPQPEAPPLFDHLGNMPDVFGGHNCAQMRRVDELHFEVACNWKLLAENALEAYHTGSVHRQTLGQQQSRSVDTHGNWTGLLVEDEHSVATLPGVVKPFPHIRGLGQEASAGAFFTLLYPSTQFVFAQDCMWWLAFKPVTVDQTQLTIGACFPASTIDLPDFEDKVKPYFDRWRDATAEDNAICEQQQLGQRVERSPGRYAGSEFAVHAFDNWVLDQLLDG